MRLLYVIDSLAPGGSESSLAAIAPHLVAAGLQMDVCALVSRPGVQTQLRRAGCGVIELNAGSRWGSAMALRSVIRSHRPDLVHTTLFEADVTGRLAAAVCRTPVVSTLARAAYGPEQFAEPNLSRWRLRSAQLADGATAQVVNRFHAVSRVVADVMARRLALRRDSIDVVWRGRDRVTLGEPDAERRRAAREWLGAGPASPVVLVVARHEWPKGIDLALRAMPSVLAYWPSAHLYVAGRTGTASGRLHQMVRTARLESAVTFLGARDDVADLLCAANVVMLPSRNEGLPGAALEAMAMEAPLVVTDIDPFREVLVDETLARFVGVDDPQGLAEAVVDTLNDPNAAATRAGAARARFESLFTIEKAAANMMTFYKRSLGEF